MLQEKQEGTANHSRSELGGFQKEGARGGKTVEASGNKKKGTIPGGLKIIAWETEETGGN